MEKALRTVFLPRLFHVPDLVLNDRYCSLLALPTCSGGLRIRNPLWYGPECHAVSMGCTAALVASLHNGKSFDLLGYKKARRDSLRESRKAALECHESEFEQILTASNDANFKRIVKRAQHTGSWLTTSPFLATDATLSAVEFVDGLRLRYAMEPLHVPRFCDGCGVPTSAAHARSCRHGGYIIYRHNVLNRTWHDGCVMATSQTQVRDEPLIHTYRAVSDDVASITPVPPNTRGDVAVTDFWARGTDTIFDIQVVDLDCPSYASKDPRKVLEGCEKTKKNKHLDNCLEGRRHFTPLVFSADGLMGQETQGAVKRLASFISEKLGSAYSAVCGFIRSRLQIALVRTLSASIRRPRKRLVYASSALASGFSSHGLLLHGG